MKKISLLLSALFIFLLFPKDVEAKVLPQARSGQRQSAVARRSSSTGIGVFPRLRSDRKALVVNFSNLQNATAVSYLLTYKTSTQEEGAMGGFSLTGSPTETQELLFGTCSKNVCRYHTNISNARLEVSYTSKSGNKYIKRFKIRV